MPPVRKFFESPSARGPSENLVGRLLFLFFSFSFALSLAAVSSAQAIDFVRDVQPILSAHCLKCHGLEKQKSGYRLDDKTSAFQGGDSGQTAIVISNSASSALLQRVTTTNTDEMMPPKGERLSSNEVAAIRAWIDAGASWPRSSPLAASSTHWSFQPIRRPEIPRVENTRWVRNPIDSFVLARLQRAAMKSSPEADRATLIRRLHLDLIGLPPTRDQVDAFVHDRRRDAYERLVDVLLASPHFGERWGRHWLDLARYADSAGYQIDRVRPGAYLFRDWVVESFNRDQPFDQFTIEQLAGDLLPNATLQQKIATGFHRMTLSNFEDGVDQNEYECKAKVDRVATTGTAWLGLTVGCAECHTHKYDPITQREFYQLYAFFDAAAELDVPAPQPGEREKFERSRQQWELERTQLEAARSHYADAGAQTNFMQWQRTVDRKSVPQALAEILNLPAEQRTTAQKRDLWKHYREVDPGMKDFGARLNAHQRQAPVYHEEQALVLAAKTNAPKTFVHVRGDFLTRGDEVEPGVVRVLNSFRPQNSRAMKADRLDLALWIASPENPLTARVAVNRMWQHLFGRGLVNTPEDFGTRGEAPSHPELLDWLADEFRRGGWSQKQIIRLIVTSATYRQSSCVRPEMVERDSQNVLLARQNRFRVESEIVRDLFLSASGLLNDRIGGPGIYPPIPEDVKAAGYGSGGEWIETQAPEKYRRGLYVVNRRTVPYPTAMTFDQANPNECSARRERSNTPLQPLALLNNPMFAECAEALGKRIETWGGEVRDRIEFGFRLCLGRKPARAELNRLEQLWRDEQKRAHATEPQAWRAVAEVLLNLDEFITRE
ncbi:MAG TPA: PSD1 and planctomycete cytochrome C domain-containing protein [Candidatus Limnocylindria bacterium]|nr:PSD1 and planctomycete cytochrome C domain-containing protein [Candidatus Limnocylindria bacterium]